MLDLITEHMDIWTAAQTQKANGGRGRGKKSNGQSSYGIKKLRELILDLAVRGKLVPQDPNDEPAWELLKKIAREKSRLIKTGKIKKQKSLPEMGEDEKTFDLPEGWEWTRLGNVIEFVNGFAFKSSDFSDIGVGIVKIGDIQNGEITTNSMSRVEDIVVSVLDDSLKVNKGELLIAMSGATTGKLGFNTKNEIFYINQRVGKISPYLLYVKYLYYPLTTKIADNLSKSMGSAIPNLSTAQIKAIVFALPPLPEQHRIVAKVDELMALCDQLEQQQTDSNATHQTLVETLLATLTDATDQRDFAEAWKRMANHFDTLFTTEQSIDQLKQTILQLAVMGKLVPQDPNDEPVGELLKKIAKEKARLVKTGKIKKQKPLPEITENEKPFELPVGWEWVQLGNLDPDFQNGVSSRGDKEGREIVVLRLADINNWRVSLKTTRSLKIKETSIAKYSLKENDVLIIRVNGSADIVGRFILCDRYFDAIYCDHFIRMRFHNGILTTAYLELLGASKLIRNSISTLFVSTAGQKTVNQKHIKSLLITLPPIFEQHRIVAKVDELMALCDTLKACLKDAQTTQVQLADAIVDQAVA